jgi:hypothetical protein
MKLTKQNGENTQNETDQISLRANNTSTSSKYKSFIEFFYNFEVINQTFEWCKNKIAYEHNKYLVLVTLEFG